jgi:hypothetical protein
VFVRHAISKGLDAWASGYLGWSESSSGPFVTTFDEWRLAEPSLGSPTV